MVPATIMYEFGAYGLPGRFSHWTHGRAYQQIKTMYDYGLSKIYELVINTNPAYAFLLENNRVLQNKLVAAHVLGHVDFFKHNAYFEHTNRADGRDGQHATPSASASTSSSTGATRSRASSTRCSRSRSTSTRTRDCASRSRRLSSAAAAQRPTDLRRPVLPGRRAASQADGAAAQFPAEPEKDLLLFLAEHGAGAGGLAARRASRSCGPSSCTSSRRCRPRS